MDKFSELSKPTACRNKFTGRTFNATKNTEPQIYESLYSQEYVSALLAELEAKDEALRELAFRVSAGGYNADSVDADVFKQNIIDGINSISAVLIKRIAELERANQSQDDHINQQQDRIDSLEKKNGDVGRSLGAAEKRLATPVRLPEPYQTSCGADERYLCPVEVADAIRTAGFKVEGVSR
ncbi:TPA: hypothetical protein I9281_001247 [Serratia marcescens]|nr:hypothetical protein [Serratia marcescens]